jgi:hypothetical protein
MDIKELEQRITDLERRFFPIESFLYDNFREPIEVKKNEEIQRDGTTYTISAVIETDKGKKTIQFPIKAWSEKQALYFANEKVIFPNMSKLQSEGKIRWFKTISKQIVKG